MLSEKTSSTRAKSGSPFCGKEINKLLQIVNTSNCDETAKRPVSDSTETATGYNMIPYTSEILVNGISVHSAEKICSVYRLYSTMAAPVALIDSPGPY